MTGRKLGLVLLVPLASCVPLPPKQCVNPSQTEERLTPILAEARQAAYDKNYELALQKTGEVLRFRGDPDEGMAWAIRGSAFFLMGKKSKAKSAWKRAYRGDPCMKELPALLESLETLKPAH